MSSSDHEVEVELQSVSRTPPPKIKTPPPRSLVVTAESIPKASTSAIDPAQDFLEPSPHLEPLSPSASPPHSPRLSEDGLGEDLQSKPSVLDIDKAMKTKKPWCAFFLPTL